MILNHKLYENDMHHLATDQSVDIVGLLIKPEPRKNPEKKMKKDKRLCAIRSSIEQHLHINADIHHQYSNNLCIISVDTNLNQVLTRYRCNR